MGKEGDKKGSVKNWDTTYKKCSYQRRIYEPDVYIRVCKLKVIALFHAHIKSMFLSFLFLDREAEVKIMLLVSFVLLSLTRKKNNSVLHKYRQKFINFKTNMKDEEVLLIKQS